ncbi:MAG: purine-nucleoside phosphorylase [Planctomycetes bacterium]|nr:purine-nucleoside phosphorylase [Planctomycetota bacterium]
MKLRQRIQEAVESVRARQKPEFAIVLGTGLDGLAERIKVDRTVPYSRIPNFSATTVAGHRGDLVFGTLERRRVVALRGRLHFYEGHSLDEVVFPVRVARALGAKALIVSNACGGLNPLFSRGDIMLIDDHINLMGGNPLVGPNDDAVGPRFPDMSEPYDRAFLELAEQVALGAGIRLRRGVYAAMSGPCLETRAEYRMLRTMGADAVGMSTVPEVIAGVHAGFRVLGVSAVTDLCFPECLKKVRLEEIVAIARATEPMMTELVRRFVAAARV